MKTPVFIGTMRHLATAEAPVDVADDAGAVSRSFSAYAQVWCHIRPMKQTTRFEADRKTGVATHMLIFRSIPSFGADWRFRLGGRLFQVLAFDDGDERQGFTRAFCEEVTP